MTVNRFGLLNFAVLLLVGTSGCIVYTSGSNRQAYDTCGSSDTCAASTACYAVQYPSGSGTFCSSTCVTSSDCPSDPAGNPVTCLTTNTSGTSTSQCYRTCPSGTCPAGETCVGVPGTAGSTVNTCIPGAGAACGAIGQACCSGNTCTESGAVCSAGTCAAACGAVGQACCSGNTCTDPGAACTSAGDCQLAPYSGCANSSLGVACASGLNASGAVIDTTCMQPPVANPGPNGFCSRACSATSTAMSECPTWVGADRQYSYNCYVLQGASQGVCFVECPAGVSCPTNTTCTAAVLVDGTTTQLCMPMTH